MHGSSIISLYKEKIFNKGEAWKWLGRKERSLNWIGKLLIGEIKTNLVLILILNSVEIEWWL